MRIIFVIFLLGYCFQIFGQDDYSIKIQILDSLIIKNKRQQAVKINVSLEKNECSDTVFLYLFNQFVNASGFISSLNDFNLYKNSSTGLNFIVEDAKKNKIQANMILVSYVKPEAEIESLYKRMFVNKSNLKIKYKLLKDWKERNEYDIGKYTLSEKNQIIELFPLINHYFNLPKGEYYLYFVYSFNSDIVNKPPPSGIWDSEKPDDNKIFNGSFVSNKVKLIIK